MDLFDTHCHIQSAGNPLGEQTTYDIWAKDPSLSGDSMIASAAEVGVRRLLCVGCDIEDSKLAVAFAETRENVWASIGIHPHEAQNYIGQAYKLAEFAALAGAVKTIAVGECGLDYFYTHSPKAAQFEILKFQLELAVKHDKPMVFHVREAFDDFWPIFDEYAGVRGVLHSFTDSKENLQKALERGLYIGVNGIVTFAKNPAQLEMYQEIPLNRLLLETDAPYLTPTPYRGKINQPKYVRVLSEFVATLRGESHQELAAVTSQNAKALFRL